jgi:hypothetical protein
LQELGLVQRLLERIEDDADGQRAGKKMHDEKSMRGFLPALLVAPRSSAACHMHSSTFFEKSSASVKSNIHFA